MKCERLNEEKKFVPVVITIETPEELEDMRHIFNKLYSDTFYDYIEEHNIEGDKRARVLAFDEKIHKELSNV